MKNKVTFKFEQNFSGSRVLDSARDSHFKGPSPELLVAFIHQVGECSGEISWDAASGEYKCAFVCNKDGMICTESPEFIEKKNAVVTKLAALKELWDKSPKKTAEIRHQSYYWGDDVFLCDTRTTIIWQDLEWDSFGSTHYGMHTDTLKIEMVDVPIDATVTHESARAEEEAME